MKTVLKALIPILIPFMIHAQHGFIEQDLLDQLADPKDKSTFPILLLLDAQVDMDALKAEMVSRKIPVKKCPTQVMRRLKALAAETQPALLEFVARHPGSEGSVQSFWISNSLAFSASAELIQDLSMRPEVAYITLNRQISGFLRPVNRSEASAESTGGSEPGLATIGASELWSMGYTGHGRMAMILDGGVWPEHPAVGERFLYQMLPAAQTWLGINSPAPTDEPGSHGTHVTGTVLGLEQATNDTIGVAPGAHFIACNYANDVIFPEQVLADYMAAFEWALNPDGDEDTVDDVPDVINNSWGFFPESLGFPQWSMPPCPAFVVPVFNAVETAGIANVFCAGNSGPDAMTTWVPQNTNTGLVNTFAVGAVNGNMPEDDFPIAVFSSRGPGFCDGEGSLLIKPEVVAPGVAVRSAVGSDGYELYSGTSMAAPHVSGAVLLLKEAFPEVTGEEILLALYHSATDLGEPGEDNTYGMGLINVKAAFDHLAETHDPVPPAQNDFDLEILAIAEPSAPWRCSAAGTSEVEPVIVVRNAGINPVTGITVEYRINGGETSVYEDAGAVFAPDTDTEVALPSVETAGPGKNELHARIVPLENEYDLFNNNAVKRWLQKSAPQDGLLTFFEDFENGFGPELWTVYNPDNDITWDTALVVQSDGSLGYAAWMRFGSYAPASGQEDLLIGPSIIDPAEDYTLTFDYYYRRRTNNPNNFDTLSVAIGYNCGEEKLELWRKGGEELYTNDVHLPNAFPETADEWASVSLTFSPQDLEGADMTQGIFPIFTGHNRRGNNLFVDNIQLDFTSGTAPTLAEREVRLFPNPASTAVRTEWDGLQSNAQLNVYDLRGKAVLRVAVISSGAVTDISALSPGVYLTELVFENGERSIKKLVKQ